MEVLSVFAQDQVNVDQKSGFCCEECSSTTFINDYKTGDFVCSGCGLVLNKDKIITRSNSRLELKQPHHEISSTPIGHNVVGNVLLMSEGLDTQNVAFRFLQKTAFYTCQEERNAISKEKIAMDILVVCWEYIQTHSQFSIPYSVKKLAHEYLKQVVDYIGWDSRDSTSRSCYGYCIASLYLACRIEFPVFTRKFFEDAFASILNSLYTYNETKIVPLSSYVRNEKALLQRLYNEYIEEMKQKKKKGINIPIFFDYNNYSVIVDNYCQSQLQCENSSLFQIFSLNCGTYVKVKELTKFLIKKWLYEGKRYSDEYLIPAMVRMSLAILTPNYPALKGEKKSTTINLTVKEIEKWLGCKVEKSSLNNYITIHNPSGLLQHILKRLQ